MLCKCLGIINISYNFGSNGLLVKSTNSTYYSFLEITKAVLLVIFTYNIHKKAIFHEYIIVYKFWVVIITSKISETWIIKYDKYLKLSLCQKLFLLFFK